MAIQVLDGGLAQAPVYDVPQYPNQGFDCGTIGELVDAAQKIGLPLSNEARDYYVKNPESMSGHTLFSTAIFNPWGEEIASISYIMKRGQFHAKPDGKGRIWDADAVKSTNPRDITHLIRG